jgi:hypothetical protein
MLVEVKRSFPCLLPPPIAAATASDRRRSSVLPLLGVRLVLITGPHGNAAEPFFIRPIALVLDFLVCPNGGACADIDGCSRRYSTSTRS